MALALTFRDRRHRRVAWAVAALLAVAGLSLLAARGSNVVAMGPVADLMAMLDARSPGERLIGALSQKADRPPARVLGKIFPPQPSPTERLAKLVTPPSPLTPVATDVPPVLPPLVPVTIAQVIMPQGPATSLAPPPPTNSFVLAPPQSQVAAAVPEPGTWLMMLVGFAMVGGSVRRTPALRRAAC